MAGATHEQRLLPVGSSAMLGPYDAVPSDPWGGPLMRFRVVSAPHRGECLGVQQLLGPNLWHREVATNLASEAVGYLRVPRHRLNRTGLWIEPQGMGTSFTLEVTPLPPQMLEQTAPLHPTMTVSRMASGGTPRKPSSRRSARIRAMASTRLSRASSGVRP